MKVVIGYEGSTEEQPLNHVESIDQSPVDGIEVSFRGPDGNQYGTDTFRQNEDGRPAYVKSVEREDHEV